MKRIAIFAHYDKDNLIEDYVIYYLKELNKVADKIIFVSDGNIANSELEKINNITTHSIVKKHNEHDFGSYKRGYLLAKELGYLETCDELIFCNDSCYGPLYPFEEMFNKMSPQQVDFWGITENPKGIILENNEIKRNQPLKHVQSFFVVFKPQIFNSEIFENFIQSIKHEESKDLIIINYEEGLTQLLTNNGFKYEVYCQNSKQKDHAFLYEYVDLLVIDKNPLVKAGMYRKIYRFIRPNYRVIKKHTNYNIKLIRKDVKRNKKPLTLSSFIQSIFSIGNTASHKVIMIGGFPIRIKRVPKS